MTGAMFIAHCLQQEGVTKVFGQCGHTNYALIDACHKLGIEYVSFRHEQQAAHAADAYFRVSHKLAVLNVHLSPGLTNALTGVATAAADCTPMVVIAGNTPSYHHAREPHQGIRFHADASQGDIYRPICKRVWRVDDAKFLPDVMPRALEPGADRAVRARCCSTCRWTCSRSTSTRRASHTSRGGRHYGRAGRRRRRHRRGGAAAAVGEAAGRSSPATAWCCPKRPTSCGSSPSSLAMPVATTLMGKGVFPEDHPLALGMTGIWGTRVANDTTRERRRHPRGRHRRSARPTAARGTRSTRSRFRRRS